MRQGATLKFNNTDAPSKSMSDQSQCRRLCGDCYTWVHTDGVAAVNRAHPRPLEPISDIVPLRNADELWKRRGRLAGKTGAGLEEDPCASDDCESERSHK